MSFKPTRLVAGFTLAEILIVLAITGLLLAAVAVTFNASVMGYQENEAIFKTVNDGRQALLRITSQLRTGHFVDTVAPSNECSFLTANDEDITYQYRSADNKLYLITNDDLTDSDYLLCENVTSMSFTKTLTDDGLDCKSVQISMTIQNNNTVKTFTAAAVIWRNLERTVTE
ncbi:MAG: PulJ/GspJ family protein [Planctomycetota bacterium]|jgi:prepilin-type N-terminal cleavage/methylation domain-containing protein